MESPKNKPDNSGPLIMVATRHDPSTGKPQIDSLPFTPGMIIERAGRKYQVDKNGTQRRIK